MAKSFQQIKFNLIKKERLGTYIRYAFGELILVTLGILIALSINTRNEERKKEKAFQKVLEAIEIDMKTDTLVANTIISYYEDNAKNSQRVLNNEFNRNNYKSCPSCGSLVTIYRPFVLQNKGFLQLQKATLPQSAIQDPLLINLTQAHTLFKENLEASNRRIENEVLKNLDSFKKYSWFVDWTRGVFNEEMVIFFTESDTYKKQVAAHNLLAANNHLHLVKAYKENANILLTQITKRLDSISNK